MSGLEKSKIARKIFLKFTLLCSFFAVLFVIFNWLMFAIVHHRDVVTVPSIVGKSLYEGVDILSKNKLGLQKDGEEPSSYYPQGTIIRQTPLSGMIVRKGKIVKVTTSLGSETVFVPNLVNETVRKAEILLQRAGLTLGSVEKKYSMKYARGTIISQEPSAEAIVEKDSIVNVTVSEGSPPQELVLMPDFIGKNIVEAKKWLEERDITANIVEEQSSLPEGSICSQMPPPDTLINSATQIELVVSTSKEEKTIGQRFYYEIPQGSSKSHVKIMMIDDFGEREIFNNVQSPGSKIDIPIRKSGKAKIRIFINNILVEEQLL